MKDLYDHFIAANNGRPYRSHIGGIYFDEVKIKEGLVRDSCTDELVGFIDNTDQAEVENLVATHVLQFSIKSLFSKNVCTL